MRPPLTISVPPRSPPRRTIVLSDIPEVRPGPNAFAQQALNFDKYRLQGNAFYQRAVQERESMSPTDLHPALRRRSLSGPDALDADVRDSRMTTMSPFVNAGKIDTPQLVPGHFAEPTRRGYIEEQREQQLHVASGRTEERTPVYLYTPKTSGSEFAKPTSLQKSGLRNEFAPVDLPKSPKKSLFERLLKPLSGISSPSSSTLSSVELAPDYIHGALPPKARALLGSPTLMQGALPRSPSKRKNFFSSRSSKHADASHASTPSWGQKFIGLQPEDYDEQPREVSTSIRTPQTGSPDPAHYMSGFQQYERAQPRVDDLNTQRAPSAAPTKTPQTGYSDSEHYHSGFGPDQNAYPGSCGSGNEQPTMRRSAVNRSQSLKYFDHAPPPTPPAKNTPPDQKRALKIQDAQANVTKPMPFDASTSTPCKTVQGSFATSDGHGAITYGAYGTRAADRLVTKPSIYSMHASVVPEMTEIDHFKDMKARMEGLGLEGFSLPEETTYRASPEMVYTPSIYPGDWQDGSPRSMVRTQDLRSALSEMPLAALHPYHSQRRDHNSSSTSGTLPVCYPGLATDPSVQNVGHARPRPGHRGDSSDSIPHHGRTHARDHSNSSGSPYGSTGSQLFALGIDGRSPELGFEALQSIQHRSAMPSPLRFLPATTYTPVARGIREAEISTGNTLSRQSHQTDAAGLGILSADHSRSLSPAHTTNPLISAPVLPARVGSPKRVFGNLVLSDRLDQQTGDSDPQKTDHSTPTQATDKLDQILALLSRTTRNEEMEAMRDEMRETNHRLSERLAAMEEQQLQSSPPSTPTSSLPLLHDDTHRHKKEQMRTQLQLPTNHPRLATEHPRIATQDAVDFYRHESGAELLSVEDAQKAVQRNLLESVAQSAVAPSMSLASTSPADAGTIVKLQEDNRQLVEIVQGFAAQLQEMEKRMGGRGENGGGRRADAP